MTLFDGKGPKWPKRWPKRGEHIFCLNIHVMILVRPQMQFQNAILAKSYDWKNWPNDSFWVIGQIWVKNGPKQGKKQFCQNIHWVNIVINHKFSFNMQNQEIQMSGFEKFGQNVRIWTKMAKFW